MNIIEEIKKLEFPQGQYVVVGSAPMVIRGMRETNDIDIVVSAQLFEKCKNEGWEQIPWTYPDKIGQKYLRRNDIELFLDVNCGTFNPTLEELITRTDTIEGIPFAALTDIMQFKQAYNTPKHLEDIKKIQGYLNI